MNTWNGQLSGARDTPNPRATALSALPHLPLNSHTREKSKELKLYITAIMPSSPLSTFRTNIPSPDQITVFLMAHLPKWSEAPLRCTL